MQLLVSLCITVLRECRSSPAVAVEYSEQYYWLLRLNNIHVALRMAHHTMLLIMASSRIRLVYEQYGQCRVKLWPPQRAN